LVLMGVGPEERGKEMEDGGEEDQNDWTEIRG